MYKRKKENLCLIFVLYESTINTVVIIKLIFRINKISQMNTYIQIYPDR